MIQKKRLEKMLASLTRRVMKSEMEDFELVSSEGQITI